MESIVAKLKLLNCPEEMYQNAYKHIASLNLVSLEELNSILSFLFDKGIIKNEQDKILLAPENFSILCNGLEVIKERVGEMERIGEIDALKEKPIRINSKTAVSRLEYLKSIDEPYKTPEGKYSKVPFSLREFQRKYDMEIEHSKTINNVNIENNEPKITDDVSMQIENAFSEPSQVEEETHFVNPYEEILNAPQTIGLNDETFDRYERLADSIKNVMVSVYGIEEVNDTITDNLIKLVTNEIMDDSQVMYYAITYGKNISDEEAQRIKDCISEELEYTSILDVNLGRAT